MAAGANRPMTNTMTGSGFAAASATGAGRRSLSCRLSLPPTAITASSPAARRYTATSWKAAAGKPRRQLSKTQIAWPIPPPCADGSGVWILLGRRFRSCAGRCMAISAWMAEQSSSFMIRLPLRSAHLYSLSRSVLAFAALKKTDAAHHPCLGIRPPFRLRSTQEAKAAPWPRIWSGSNSASRCWSTCSGTTGALSCRRAPGVRRAVSFTPGDPSFLLRQCRQEPVLLPRLRPGRRPDSLCPALPRSAVPPNRGASRTGTNAGSGFPVAGAVGRLLSASTPSPFGSGPLSGAPRIARSRPDRRTRHRLCSRRKLAAPSCGSDQQYVTES